MQKTLKFIFPLLIVFYACKVSDLKVAAKETTKTGARKITIKSISVVKKYWTHNTYFFEVYKRHNMLDSVILYQGSVPVASFFTSTGMIYSPAVSVYNSSGQLIQRDQYVRYGNQKLHHYVELLPGVDFYGFLKKREVYTDAGTRTLFFESDENGNDSLRYEWTSEGVCKRTKTRESDLNFNQFGIVSSIEEFFPWKFYQYSNTGILQHVTFDTLIKHVNLQCRMEYYPNGICKEIGYYQGDDACHLRKTFSPEGMLLKTEKLQSPKAMPLEAVDRDRMDDNPILISSKDPEYPGGMYMFSVDFSAHFANRLDVVSKLGGEYIVLVAIDDKGNTTVKDVQGLNASLVSGMLEGKLGNWNAASRKGKTIGSIVKVVFTI